MKEGNCGFDIDDFQQIAMNNHINGKIFIKGSPLFKTSANFAKVFQSMKGYNRKSIATIYVKMNRWKFQSIQVELKNNHAELHQLEPKEINNADDDKTDDHDNETSIYDIGTRFYFWDSVKHYKHYIQAKHYSLKHEILKNKLLTFTVKQWNYLYKECETEIKTDIVKQIACNGLYQPIYKIEKSTPFSTEHLFALKLYTDYSVQCKTFCSTLRS
eukprot:110076_1